MLHPLVLRQVRKLGLDETAPPSAEAWRSFLERVSQTYADTDQERYLRQRSQNLADEEMQILSTNLAAARDEALALARVKSEFLANMSHEIRTPLNGVLGLCTLLLELPLAEEQRELATAVRASGDALLAIVGDVLDFSKLDAGHIELEETEFRPRQILQEVGDITAGRAHEVDLELVLDADASVPEAVRGDPGRLRQVLLNLTNNAIKFTERGEVVVRMRARPSDREGSAVLEVEVSDTGIGIPPDRHERLFRAFSQVDASTTRRYGGTGLGLAICRQLVTAMGGSIGVRSAEGAGSTFWFTVELERCEREPERIDVDPLSVAVVDPNASAREHACALLRSWGHRAEAFDEHPGDGDAFDVVVIGGNCALEIARRVRRTRSSARLVLSTASRRGLAPVDHGLFDAIVHKPIKADALRRALRPADGDAPPAPAPRALAPVDGSRSGRRILVVDDNLVNQQVTGRLLRSAGYDFALAHNGSEALERLACGSFDAVLMDCQMPVMDGYEATRELRRRQGDRSRLPVIALTASALPSDRDACFAADMDAYVTKPVRAVELMRVLDAYLSSPEEKTA